MSFHYKVPTIPQNLSKEETVVQIAEVLNYLSEVTDDILNKVSNRIAVNAEKVSNISERLDAASQKINKLRGAKKATRVFSSSKYPANDLNSDYVSIFNGNCELELQRHIVKHANYSSSYEPLNKLQFYHVKVSNNTNNESLDGLGNIPPHINCVNDLLLYNSGKNLYKSFTITDSLKGHERLKKTDTTSTSEIGAAPLSISERSTLAKSKKESYFYNPKNEELPALDVPIDLPDLPGIADDLRYENEVNIGIVPSTTTDGVKTENEPVTMVQEIDAINIAEILPPLPDDLPKPPVNEPICNNEVPEEINNNAKKQEPIEDVPKEIKSPNSDIRANLMEAIRQAGGSQNAKLKSTRKSETNLTTNPPVGDLMADLHSKLLMRRKGISGSKKTETEKVSSESTMAKISAMIPAPPAKTENETASTDEEWD